MGYKFYFYYCVEKYGIPYDLNRIEGGQRCGKIKNNRNGKYMCI